MINLRNKRYVEWLISQIECGPERYKHLFLYLHEKEFVWIVPNDDNRVMDALELRREFFQEQISMIRDGATVLEAIVALSRRVAFNAGGYPEEWAWKLIKNIGLDRFPDPVTEKQEEEIEELVQALIWRTYSRNGEGGFFPLERSKEDQREVEIWYQMSAYIQEKHLV